MISIFMERPSSFKLNSVQLCDATGTPWTSAIQGPEYTSPSFGFPAPCQRTNHDLVTTSRASRRVSSVRLLHANSPLAHDMGSDGYSIRTGDLSQEARRCCTLTLVCITRVSDVFQTLPRMLTPHGIQSFKTGGHNLMAHFI